VAKRLWGGGCEATWLGYSEMKEHMSKLHSAFATEVGTCALAEVDAFYWTVLAPDIVNPGREEQGSFSV
jgi:hypothetical protein